jgi:hypothetical protein
MDKQPINFRVYLTINTKNGKPALEIRTLTTDTNIIKVILTSAYADLPIIVFPTFRDKLRATATLNTRKIIKFNPKTGKSEFLI